MHFFSAICGREVLCCPCTLLVMQGLLKYEYYDFNKDITLLATHVSQSSPIDPGSEITYANDLAIASDGTVYFTSCTDIVPALNRLGFYDTFRAWFLGLMQVGGCVVCGNGLLLRGMHSTVTGCCCRAVCVWLESVAWADMPGLVCQGDVI